MIKTLLYFMLILSGASVYAQSAADTAGKQSPVRTLTYQQYEDYLKGQANEDFAQVAEMNHYPLPDKVLKFKHELDLSPVQIQKLTEASKYLHSRRLQIGGSVINTEKMLDSLFKSRQMDEGNLIFFTNRYGLYQGELKNALLQACLSTEKLLSQKQMAKFESLQKKPPNPPR